MIDSFPIASKFVFLFFLLVYHVHKTKALEKMVINSRKQHGHQWKCYDGYFKNIYIYLSLSNSVENDLEQCSRAACTEIDTIWGWDDRRVAEVTDGSEEHRSIVISSLPIGAGANKILSHWSWEWTPTVTDVQCRVSLCMEYSALEGVYFNS